jgi:isochorismate hydrolase
MTEESDSESRLKIHGFQERLTQLSIDDLRLVLLGLAAVASHVLGWSLIQQALRTDPTRPVKQAEIHIPAQEQPSSAELAARADMRQKIEAQLAQSPEYMRFFDRLKLVFPSEYETIMETFAKRAASANETDDIDAMMSEAVRTLRLSHGVLAAKANGSALQKIFTMQLSMMQALATKDPRLCVDFLYGGASRGFFMFSAENRALVSDMALAGLDAITDGQTNKIERAAPSEADFQVLEKALRDQNLSTAEIEALLDGKTADPPIPDTRMCAVGQVYLQTLSGLPEAARYRLYGLAVELMARS